jgi:glycine betaine transporter
VTDTKAGKEVSQGEGTGEQTQKLGAVFWGVAESITHYNTPPLGMAGACTPEAAELAVQTAFFHWCRHQWAMYAVV